MGVATGVEGLVGGAGGKHVALTWPQRLAFSRLKNGSFSALRQPHMPIGRGCLPVARRHARGPSLRSLTLPPQAAQLAARPTTPEVERATQVFWLCKRG